MTDSPADNRDGVRQVTTLGKFEDGMLADFGRSAGTEIMLCERASICLAALLQKLGASPVRADPARDATPAELRVGAMLGIAVRTLRAIRASLAVLGVGYEIEASVYGRLLFELQGRLRQIAADATGQTARKWLSGQSPSKVGRLASDASARELYATLSKVVHADATVIHTLLEPGGDAVLFGPRRTAWTRASLLHHAVIAYEVIRTISLETGMIAPGTDELYAAIVITVEGWPSDGDSHGADAEV